MLVIDADGMKLVDAATLWGHDVFECEDILTAEYGSKISTAVIGPARRETGAAGLDLP